MPVLSQKKLTWQGQLLQRPFTVEVAGRQSCSFLLYSSDDSEAAEKMPEHEAEGGTPAALEPHGEFSAGEAL